MKNMIDCKFGYMREKPTYKTYTGPFESKINCPCEFVMTCQQIKE